MRTPVKTKTNQSTPYSAYVDNAVDLAKKGGRLGSKEQWNLADALTACKETEIEIVANLSGRKESTLLQYRRAAERWDIHDRVDGVSFSAHRVALSDDHPVDLLLKCKAKYGSPTVEQVRTEMGLEVHPLLKYLNKASQHMQDLPTKEAMLARELAQAIADNLVGVEEVGVEETEEEVEDVQDIVTEEIPAETETARPKWTPPSVAGKVKGL